MASGKLMAPKAKALTGPGRYGDGAGLWLFLTRPRATTANPPAEFTWANRSDRRIRR